MALGYRSFVDTWKQKAKKQRGIGVSHHLQWSMSLCQTDHVLLASAWDENCFLLFPVPSFMSRLASQCHRLYRQLVVTPPLYWKHAYFIFRYISTLQACTVKLTQGYTGHYLKSWALTMQIQRGFRQHILVQLLRPREWHLPPDSTEVHSSHPIWRVLSSAVAEWLVLMQQLLGWRLECS